MLVWNSAIFVCSCANEIGYIAINNFHLAWWYSRHYYLKCKISVFRFTILVRLLAIELIKVEIKVKMLTM